MQKYIDIRDAIKLVDDEDESEQYINYITGIYDRQYRHIEVRNLENFLKITSLQDIYSQGYLFGYVIPQLNKEFDLLKITPQLTINIELKGGNVSLERVKKQLVQNKHYLKLLEREIFSCTYFANSNKFYVLDNDILIEKDIEFVKSKISIEAYEDLNLDHIFSPSNILVSPLNNTDKFICKNYLLTENQINIKTRIIEAIINNKKIFFGLTGNAGTGKTLLTYDIARELSEEKKVLIIHGGILSEGHEKLNSQIKNLDIIAAKFWYRTKSVHYDSIIIDESHRIYPSTIIDIKDYILEGDRVAVFSYDEKQKLSLFENKSKTVEIIKELCENNIEKLTNKIRTNKELSLFITCLMDITKLQNNYSFQNVHIKYFSKIMEAHEFAVKMSEECGYTYITYTPSLHNTRLDYQDSNYNTHRILGQEFDKVCIIIDSNFTYSDQGQLISRKHPNPDYLFHQLLYQGLTRVRNELLLIITDKIMLKNILKIIKNNKV